MSVFSTNTANHAAGSWRRYELWSESLNSALGNIVLKEFQRKDLYCYVAKWKREVKPATVSRDITSHQ